MVHNDDELLITMKAAAIKHFDKNVAKGIHYSADADKSKATLIGGDGIGELNYQSNCHSSRQTFWSKSYF